MTNDTDEPIDIEELTTLLRDADEGRCFPGDEAPNCKSCVALDQLSALAPALAQRVVADAALLRDAREALDLVYETFGLHTKPSSIEEMAAIVEHCGELVGRGVYADDTEARTALAKLRGAT